MNEIKISLQENEANVLVQLIDVAIKAQGLQVAEAGSFLATKIEEQMKEQTAPQEEVVGAEKQAQ
tara:strand:- start:18689 stop:18883 length:195 start_codon:yes stop_codon:yes gene_type:complete